MIGPTNTAQAMPRSLTSLGVRIVLVSFCVLTIPFPAFAQIDLSAGQNPWQDLTQMPGTTRAITPTIEVTADCDGLAGTTVSLLWDGLTQTADGSCQFITVSWLQSDNAQMQMTATLTNPLTDAVSSTVIPAASHLIKMVPSANAWNGDLLQATTYTSLSGPVSLWQELVSTGEQNRSDTFQVDIRLDGNTAGALAPGNYTGTVMLTVSAF